MDTDKQCSRCNSVQPTTAFSKAARSKDGLDWICKACRHLEYIARREKVAETGKAYRSTHAAQVAEAKRAYYAKNKETILKRTADYSQKNKDKIRETKRQNYRNNRQAHTDRNKAWSRENKEKIQAAKREYYLKFRKASLAKSRAYVSKNRDRVRSYKREYYSKNKDRILSMQYARQKHKHATDPGFRLVNTLRTRLRTVIRKYEDRRRVKSEALAGCSSDHLRKHIESLFLPGMTWANHSKHGWHVDHIVQCQEFDLSDPEEQLRCFHWTNLRPMWAADNWSKLNNTPRSEAYLLHSPLLPPSDYLHIPRKRHRD